MKFEELLDIVEGRPVFSSALLRAGDVDVVDVASQLSRWVSGGRLIALRRGVYALGRAYAKRSPHPFEVANLVQRPSYVSMESALSFHGMLPEAVFATTSVTSARAGEFATQLGVYSYRHIASSLFWGYREVAVPAAAGATMLVATPEKALLDLVYLRPRADAAAFLRQLRLERLSSMDLDVLDEMTRRAGKPKLARAAQRIRHLAEAESSEWRDV